MSKKRKEEKQRASTRQLIGVKEISDFSIVTAPSQQKWTQKSFKKRNESQYFVNLLKPTAFIPRFA